MTKPEYCILLAAADSDKMIKPMKRPLPLLRLFLLAVSLALLAFSIYYFCEFRRLGNEFNAAENTKINQTDADLSHPGQYRIEFARKFRLAHGAGLFLGISPSASPNSIIDLPLNDLKAQVTFEWDDQTRSEKMTLEPRRLYLRNNEICLSGMGGGPEHFTFILDVEQGARSLAGRSQCLYARYGLCTLESLPSMISAIFSLISGLLAVLILSLVVRYTLKHKSPRSPEERAETQVP